MEQNFEKQVLEEKFIEEEHSPDEMPYCAIEELREPAWKLFEQLKPKIESGEYQMIIGEDASGRLPTLLFSKLVGRVAEACGHPKPLTRFLAGSSHLLHKPRENKVEMMREYFVTQKHSLPELRRVLIVTDTVSTGGSLAPLVEALRNEQIDFDIATFGTADAADPGQASRRLDASIYSGGLHIPEVYSNPHLAGVYKRAADLHSTRNVSDQDLINNTREIAGTIAEELFARYTQSA